jgi:hypothetical protein
MNKQQAAEFLGVSGRAVERYTQQGKLSVHYEPGKTRPVAVYREDELEPLRKEIEANLYHQRPAHEKPNPANPEQAGGLVAIQQTQALQRAGSEQSIQALGQAIADALRATQRNQDGKHDAPPPVELKDKLMLTEKEAAAYAGLSLADIERARDPLKTIKTGAGWRVKRTALEIYVKKL